MLGLAVGIDYALFILSRHRQNLGDGLEPAEAAAQATATAGTAVVFAGLTVVIALVGLTVVNIPFLTVMGLAAAGTVDDRRAHRDHAAARHPRLRRRPRGPRQPRARLPPAAQAHRRASRWAPAGRASSPRARCRRCSSASRVLGAVALPALHMKLGLPDGGSKPTSSTERRAYDLLTEGFGPGFNGPLTVVVDAPNLSAQEQKDLANKLVDGLEKVPGVAAVTPAQQNEAGDLTIALVTPTTSPASDETKDLVNAAAQQGRRHPRADRHPGLRDRHDGPEHRHGRHARRRAAALHRGRRRAGPDPADGRVPLDPGAAEGGRRASC